MEIVLNKCFGGFGLSLEAQKRYLELKGLPCYFYKQTKYSFKDGKNEYCIYNNSNEDMFVHTFTKYLGDKVDIEKLPKEEYEKYSFYYGNIERIDSILIQVIKELKDKASGECARLRIVEIPDGVEWEIDDYDGQESVHEVHRIWG